MRVLVLLVATVAFGMVGLGLARAATVFALLDGAALGVDVVQITVWSKGSAHACGAGVGVVMRQCDIPV